MDTTQILLLESQLDKIVNAINQPQDDFLSPGVIILLAAVIGALASIIPQLIMHKLGKRKEEYNQKNELIGDERRISYLLTEYYKELVMHKVHKQYWYKAAVLSRYDKEDRIDSHQRHFVSNDKSFEILNKIRETMADYFKTVTLYSNLAGENKVIIKSLKDIKTFSPRKASEYPSVENYDSLLNETVKDEEDLNEEYIYYSRCFDKIHNQMVN